MKKRVRFQEPTKKMKLSIYNVSGEQDLSESSDSDYDPNADETLMPDDGVAETKTTSTKTSSNASAQRKHGGNYTLLHDVLSGQAQLLKAQNGLKNEKQVNTKEKHKAPIVPGVVGKTHIEEVNQEEETDDGYNSPSIAPRIRFDCYGRVIDEKLAFEMRDGKVSAANKLLLQKGNETKADADNVQEMQEQEVKSRVQYKQPSAKAKHLASLKKFGDRFYVSAPEGEEETSSSDEGPYSPATLLRRSKSDKGMYTKSKYAQNKFAEVMKMKQYAKSFESVIDGMVHESPKGRSKSVDTGSVIERGEMEPPKLPPRPKDTKSPREKIDTLNQLMLEHLQESARIRNEIKALKQVAAEYEVDVSGEGEEMDNPT